MERATKRRAAGTRRRGAEAWRRGELLAVAEDLRSISERLQAIADGLAAGSTAGRRGAAERQEAVRSQLWGLAGELIGAQARLGWLGERLRSAERPAATLAGEEDLDEPAVLLAVIECVLADSLAPALRSLLQAAGSGPPDGAPL